MSTKIRQSARGQECQVRIPNVCNHDTETTVLAHINGGGMGMKQPDIEAAYCCSACHDAIDGRSGITGYTDTKFDDLSSKIKLYHHEGCMRTRKILLDMGLIEIK